MSGDMTLRPARRCADDGLDEHHIRRLVRLRLHHAQPLGLHLVLVHRDDDFAKALRQVNHRKAAAEFQCIARRADDVCERCRELMACARDAAHLIVVTRASTGPSGPG